MEQKEKKYEELTAYERAMTNLSLEQTGFVGVDDLDSAELPFNF